MSVSLALAFAAGLLSFATPCVLALVPVYLAFLGESAAGAADVSAPIAATLPGSAPPGARAVDAGIDWAIVGSALLFVTGFSAVFVLLGVSVGLVGEAIFKVAAVRVAAGIGVIGLGLLTMGVFGPILDRLSVGTPPVNALPPGRVARALALGALVGVGWTPCIGPVLGTILAMGASSQDVPVAALLLSGYSAGLAIPFIAAAVALPRARPVMLVLREHTRAVRNVAGVFIVLMGLLVLTDAFSTMAGFFSWTLG